MTMDALCPVCLFFFHPFSSLILCVPVSLPSPVMQVKLDIARTIALESGTGRAWVGVLGGMYSELPFDDDESKASRGGGAVPCPPPIELLQWKLDVKGQQAPDFDAWRGLSLSYRLRWPLHLLITQSSLAQYNTLFQFLFTVRRVGLELQATWGVLKQARYKVFKGEGCTVDDVGAAGGTAHDRLMALWTLRAQMSFLVDNLQYYLQVDVLESQWSILLERILPRDTHSDPTASGKAMGGKAVGGKDGMGKDSMEGKKEGADPGGANKTDKTTPPRQGAGAGVGAGAGGPRFEDVLSAHEEFVVALMRLSFVRVRIVRKALDEVRL